MDFSDTSHFNCEGAVAIYKERPTTRADSARLNTKYELVQNSLFFFWAFPLESARIYTKCYFEQNSLTFRISSSRFCLIWSHMQNSSKTRSFYLGLFRKFFSETNTRKMNEIHSGFLTWVTVNILVRSTHVVSIKKRGSYPATMQHCQQRMNVGRSALIISDNLIVHICAYGIM